MQEKKVLSFWLRLWRGERFGTKAFRDSMRREMTRRREWSFRSAAWYPTLLALLYTLLVVMGDPDLSALGSGGPAVITFFAIPFVAISSLFLRQQKVIEELRSRIEKDPTQKPAPGSP